MYRNVKYEKIYLSRNSKNMGWSITLLLRGNDTEVYIA